MSRLLQQKFNAANIIETAFSDENILSLLETLNIDTFASINIIQEINHSPINQSILIEIPNEGCASENQILLNVKQGQPTVDQVFSGLYELGAECQKRIIAFTGVNCWDDKYNPSADMDTVKCLVDTMNRFDLNIYLVKMSCDSTSSICNYEIQVEPSRPIISKEKCPSKEKFTEAEFWEVYFWGYNNIIEATPFEFGFDSNSEFSQCLPIGDLKLETKWTTEGAIIRIEDTSDKKSMLGDIWDDRRDEIQDMFRGGAN